MAIIEDNIINLEEFINQFSGEEGIQGIQGLRGLQGLQGLQGPKGIQGLQGLQGLRGTVGLQGTKGLQGVQGARGYKGVTGLQGTMGCQGLQGTRGVIGAQGVQGPKGSKGQKGYMGYQGDTGEVGIQGLQGDVGAVWFDGIRLNGYNTKLFVYDTSLNHFVSTNNLNTYDYLKISNGAVIKLLFDENSKSVLSNGTIPIRSVEGPLNRLTNYPAYYSENVSISTVITSQIPYRTIFEFTFYDGGWYYSGGSLGSSSSGEAVIENDIQVKGVTVGNIQNGETITAGTTMQEIFEHMLVKVTPAKATAPKITVLTPTGSAVPPNNGTVEVGNNVSFTMSSRYEDGYYSSSDTDLYPASKFDELNGCVGGILQANCNLLSTNYYRNNSSVSPTVNYQSIPEGDYTYKCSVSYGASNVVPKNDDGSDNNGIVIPGGTSPLTTSISFTSRYKLFYGNTAADVDNLYADVFTTKEQLNTLNSKWLNTNGNTSLSSMSSVTGTTAFVLAIPSTYKITATSTVNHMPVTVDEKWVYRHSVQYVNGGVSTEYKVYILHSTIPQTYTDIIITKQS